MIYGNPAPSADLVIVYGNCQVPVLARLLAAAFPNYGFVCALNHAPLGQEPETPSADHLRRCRLYLEQYDSQPDLPISGTVPDGTAYGLPLRRFLRLGLPATCPTLVFPSFVMTCLWPFASLGDPRNTPEPGYVWGRYPHGNRLALEVLARGLSGPAALDAYHRLSAERRPDPASALLKARAKLVRRDDRCDIKIADYVWANFQDCAIFQAYAHVRTEAVGELVRRLATAMEGQLSCTADSGALADALADTPDMTTVEEPIEPAVAAELGLRFYSPGMRFRWYTHSWTFDDYMSRYLSFDCSW